jgi:DNA polymerase-1
MVLTASEKIEFNYEYITEQSSLERVQEWMTNHRSFVVDTETTGLSPFNDDLVLLQVGDEEKQWIMDCRAVNIEVLEPWMSDPAYVKLGQNIKFDLKILQWKYGWLFKNVADTMIAEQVIRCGVIGRKNTVSMEALARFYLRIKLDKDKDLRTGFGKTPVGAFSERQLRYAAGDCIYPKYLARHQKPIIHKRGLRSTLSLEHAFIPVLAEMELEGMRLDTEAWTQLYQKAQRERKNAEKLLDELFQTENTSQEDMFGKPQIMKGINYGSWQQVLAGFRRLGYHSLESTHSEEVALAAIRGEIPRKLAQALIAYRIYNKRATTYGLNFLEAIEEKTGHIHSDFTQCVTHTGRLSSGQDDKEDTVSKKVNLQNIPRLPEYRHCFIPDEGDVLIVWDLKAIEPRILGDMSLDSTYVDTFMNNGDIYNALGSVIYGEPVSKEPGRPHDLRAKTKIGILGTSYGTGKKKFHRKMLLDLNRDSEGFLKDERVDILRDESDTLWEGIFEACPSIRETLDELSDLANPLVSKRSFFDTRAYYESEKKVHEKLIEFFEQVPRMSKKQVLEKAESFTKKRGYVTYSSSRNGRKRFYKVYHKTFWTDGRNHPIQATAADILKAAAVDVYREIKKNNHDAAIINQVHDELVLRCKREEAEEVNEYTRDLLEAAGNKFLKVIPCIAEGGICEKWEKD